MPNKFFYLLTCFFLISTIISCEDTSNVSPSADEPEIVDEIENNLLNSYYEEYGRRNTFPPNQVLALEALVLAQDDIESGDLESAKKRIDDVFSKMPISDPIWLNNSSNSHCEGCIINIGSPVAYYGLRMLDQIITLGNPKDSGTLNMTAVIASCAEVSRPTLPNLTPEIVNLNIAPKILENDSYILHVSTALFRNWVQAITGGLKVNLNVYTLEECTTVNYTDDGNTIVSYPDAQSMIDAVPNDLANETDFWWVIAPSGVPNNSLSYNRHFITGGMGVHGVGLPLFLSDDAWFTRKPEHLGKGLYHEVELRAYQPQWFQHEFMHHLYRTWSEFGLEETGHQWFNRSTWPSDFQGAWEPDYYAESITKRLLDATISLAEGLKADQSVNIEITNPSILIGKYQREPVQNEWHEVEIIMNDGVLYWVNAAQVSWSLKIIDGELWTGVDCPYGEIKLPVSIESNEVVKAVYFQGEAYKRIN